MVTFSALSQTDLEVQAFDHTGGISCNLGNTVTRECQIEYVIEAQSINATFGYMNDVTINWKSECWLLESLYQSNDR